MREAFKGRQLEEVRATILPYNSSFETHFARLTEPSNRSVVSFPSLSFSRRSFVPSMMNAQMVNYFEAFENYQILPPSLAKVRYEQEAWARCQKYIDQARQMGFYSIQQLMPLSRMITTFNKLEPPMPPDLLACSKAIVLALRQTSKIKLLGGTLVKNQYKDLKDGKASLGQRMKNFEQPPDEEAKPEKEGAGEEKKEDGKVPLPRADYRMPLDNHSALTALARKSLSRFSTTEGGR